VLKAVDLELDGRKVKHHHHHHNHQHHYHVNVFACVLLSVFGCDCLRLPVSESMFV
jgi:hypothetical protein